MDKEQNGISKAVVIIILIVAGVVGIGIFFRHRISRIVTSTPTSSPAAQATVSPSPAQPPLDRSAISFEVLNGSGVAGKAKTIAGQLQALGYPVVKVGNASKDYPQTQITAKQDLLGKVDLVIADLKDVIKVSSVAGQLTDSTASARLVIGKDSIL